MKHYGTQMAKGKTSRLMYEGWAGKDFLNRTLCPSGDQCRAATKDQSINQ